MYRTIIVDDEADIREGLQLLLDWKAYGFEVVGEAENGAQALEQMPIWHPEFIMTDIRMPVLDGLGYIRRIRQHYPDAVVVVISAYDDFQYAREALQLGVLDFLLKPITKQTLVQCLDRVKALLDEKHRSRYRERLQHQFIQEKWLQDLCHGKLTHPRELQAVADLLHHHGDELYQVVVIEMDDYEVYIQDFSEAEIELRRYIIRNITEEIASGYGSAVQVFEDSQERVGLLMRCTEDVSKDIRRLCLRLRKALDEIVHIPVSIGIGKPYTEWRLIRNSYQEALQALEYMMFSGKDNIFHYDQLTEYLHLDAGQHEEERISITRALLRAIDECHMDDIRTELEQFFAHLKATSMSPEHVRGVCLELMMGMIRIIREHHGEIKVVFGDRLEEYEKLYMKRSMRTIQSWLSGLCRRTAKYVSKLRTEKPPEIMEEVKRWIEAHYTEDISLKMLSAHVYKNPVYLGQLFKATFGESFSQYVTKLRMEKAKELLRRDQLRVYEIAEKVGYMRLDTFYQRFKQATGMNPTEYKQKVLLTEDGNA